MKLGADPKKVGILAGLLVVAGIVYYINSGPSASPAPAATRPSPAAANADAVAVPAPAANAGDAGRPVQRRTASGRGNMNEFTPTPPKSVDAASVDPTLRLDLLAKVQSIGVEGGSRNVFQFVAAPPPPQPKAPPNFPKVGKVLLNGQPPPPPPPGAPAAAAPAPPINLKYYGYSTKRSDGEKKAFFLDGDDIIVAAEGEMMKKRYKVVKIGVNSVQIEDTVSKSTQTLPLQQEAVTPA
jgi:hypothetical protein